MNEDTETERFLQSSVPNVCGLAVVKTEKWVDSGNVMGLDTIGFGRVIEGLESRGSERPSRFLVGAS